MQKETADKYQEFFNFMIQEHDLILTIEQMDEIVFEVQRLINKHSGIKTKHYKTAIAVIYCCSAFLL